MSLNYRSSARDVLLLGRSSCEKSKELSAYLSANGFRVTAQFFKGKGDELSAAVQGWAGDYIFSFRCPIKIPVEVINSAKFAAINFHPAPPHYRGSGGLNWALYHNENEFGSTAHLMTDEIDSGQIIECVRYPILPNDNLESLWIRCNRITFNLACRIIRGIADGEYDFILRLIEKNKIEKWSGRNRKIAEIDELQKISMNCTYDELKRVIRATQFRDHGPEVSLWEFKFKLLNARSQ